MSITGFQPQMAGFFEELCEMQEQEVLLQKRQFRCGPVSYTHLDVYKRQVHCKAFRRLKQKTQVFLLPKGDHYRTRLTHTLEVSQNARTIAKALRLNEELVEAIALGHDLGHTPFGHAGERALNELCPGGFKHNEQSVRVVESIEKEGRGLNLTWEVIDGIRNHKTSGRPSTLEGQIVRLSDKIAYINPVSYTHLIRLAG